MQVLLKLSSPSDGEALNGAEQMLEKDLSPLLFVFCLKEGHHKTLLKERFQAHPYSG